MKTYPEEHLIHQKNVSGHVNKLTFPMTDDIYKQIQKEIQKIRFQAKEHPLQHNIFQLLPIVILVTLYYFLFIFTQKISSGNMLVDLLLFALVHGILSYSFVIYTLHEGAGHGLFRSIEWLEKIYFHLSRIFFADPHYYRRIHNFHHRFLGTEKDGAFTHFVLPLRIIKSMLPGAGILFKNDYKIAQPETITSSTLLSIIIGLSTIILQAVVLKDKFPMTYTIFALLIIGPWISMILDRFRESIEHCNLPSNNHTGSWEMGPTTLGFLIGGGPWGQPCHFSHHIAPDLTWHQQLALHKFIKRKLPLEFTRQFGFNISVLTRIKSVIKYYLPYLKKQKTLL